MESSDERREALRRWRIFWDSLSRSAAPPGAGPEEEFAQLDRRYREAQRHYHAWRHICACLAELEGVRHLALHPVAVELALWFHDAVYDPGASDNEERSARLARECAGRLKLPPGVAEEAEELVLATRHLAGPQEGPAGRKQLCPQDCALVRDIDLSILGRPGREFAAYEEAIGREYAQVPDRQRWGRRMAILEELLARPRIYETGHFRRRYERRARRNLRRSIARLRRLLAG